MFARTRTVSIEGSPVETDRLGLEVLALAQEQGITVVKDSTVTGGHMTVCRVIKVRATQPAVTAFVNSLNVV